MTSIETIEITGHQSHEVIAVSQHERIIEAASLMCEHSIGCLVVAASSDDETMVGVISERDILGWISNATSETYFQTVSDIMTRDVIFCEPGTPMSERVKLMKQHHMRHMPIVRNGVATGMLSVRDLL